MGRGGVRREVDDKIGGIEEVEGAGLGWKDVVLGVT